MEHRLLIDIETYSGASIAKAGAFRYAEDEDFQILLFGYKLDDDMIRVLDLANGDKVPSWIYSALEDPNIIKIAYNASFEWICLSRFVGYDLPIDQWRDLMFRAAYFGYPNGLSAVGKVMGLSEDQAKMREGRALIKLFCNPQPNGKRVFPKDEPEKWFIFKKYCEQDVRTEFIISEKLPKIEIPQWLQKQWETDLAINHRGVAVDLSLVDSAITLNKMVSEPLLEEAKILTKLENPNSVAQLSNWAEDKLGQAVSMTKDTVSDLLARNDIDPEMRRALEIRQQLSKSSTKKYDAVLECVGSDGRIRGLLQFYGAGRTGRWAGRLVQVQNLPRNSLEPLDLARDLVKSRELEKLQLIFGSVPQVLSELIRTAFIPGTGKILIDADFSSIEARVISWLAGEQWRMDVFRTHGKIYEASASQMFNVPIEKIKKGNPEYELRRRGKVAELALGYQGGVGALVRMGALDMGLEESELPDIVSRWRQANPSIRNLWTQIQSAATAAIAEGREVEVNGKLRFQRVCLADGYDALTIRLPSGRCLYYLNPIVSPDLYGGNRIVFSGVDQASNQWRLVETYGGKLTENCVQAIARDCLAEAIDRLTEAGYEIVFHIHDEIVLEAKDHEDLFRVKDIMCQPMPWAEDLPLNAAGQACMYFQKD